MSTIQPYFFFPHFAMRKLAILLAIGLSACSASVTPGTENASSASSEAMMEESSAAMMDDTSSAAADDAVEVTATGAVDVNAD